MESTYKVKVSYTCEDRITGDKETGTEVVKIEDAESDWQAADWAEERITDRLGRMNYEVSNFCTIRITKI